MRFCILLKGKGFVSRRKNLARLSTDGRPGFPFLTTRVVDAPNVDRAIELAIAQVSQDE
jgi:hypothetical protein